MLDPNEAAAIAEGFGVARTQVRRDHLISHLLAAVSEHLPDEVLFFGGTALSRTFAPHGRLSEDIDLIAHGNRSRTAKALDTILLRATRREYPGLRWQPALSAVSNSTPAVLAAPDGTSVRIQLLSPTGYPPWPVEPRAITQRYSDTPPATLRVPTAPPSQPGKPSPGHNVPLPATSTISGCWPASASSPPMPPSSSNASAPPTGHRATHCSPMRPRNPHGRANSPGKPA